MKKDYFLDVILMGILGRIKSGRLRDELDKQVTYYENFIKHYGGSEFHRKFSSLIKEYLDVGYNERKDVCKKRYLKVESSKETFNHFHSVFLHWLKQEIERK